MNIKFYKCNICGLIVEVVDETGVTPVCCGLEMTELIPGSVDASYEKHVPVIEAEGRGVHIRVGSNPHPMTKDHRIEWVELETGQGTQRKMLAPDMRPEACFCLCDGDEIIAAYAYCDLHGLWRAEVRKMGTPSGTET